MDPSTVTGRVVHGGYPFFKEAAPRIEAVVPEGDLPILTRGALHLSPPPTSPYWFYNTEPLHVRRKRGAQYMNLLSGAERVFDYSEPNLRWYLRGEFCPIALGPVAPRPDPGACDVDVLFYGHMTDRRAQITGAVNAREVRAYGARLTPWLRRAKIVLCVNAYDDINGNPFRAFPALEQGARLVIEHCQEESFNEAVRPYAVLAVYADLVWICQTLLDRNGANGA